MNQVEQIEAKLKEDLSEYRYKHILGVEKMSVEIATRYGLDIEKCKMAALLHDITKENDKLNTAENVSEITDDTFIQTTKALWHSITGAHYAQKKLGIEDQDILDAIKYHTIGYKNMNDIAKVVFISDVLEEGRTNTASVEARNKFRKNSNMTLDALLLCTVEIKINYLKKQNQKSHPNLMEMYENLK